MEDKRMERLTIGEQAKRDLVNLETIAITSG
jgi:hypothetical protein